ncbi:DcaP family trimeric outer membrane transporter [Faecalibacter rhinopitheci]|uniref:Porin n=1 Tax=Faecalibacter rhinopitheci TaxID=2779678 RepID=A0A8J7FKW6_9FLAO|nr:DcaP family trimeric outer membrane transporter [Faecalibacter rhinopitheci]MBF0595965.1 hypothetical protein [Faecalibacter rhinopitheci]MBQ0148666.1 hypothetical protein [Candidatus Onthonaster equi]
MRRTLINLSLITALFSGLEAYAQNLTTVQNDSILVNQIALESLNNQKVKVDFYGFIRNDAFVDTRQNIGAGENAVMLYPKDRQLDLDGNDINAVGKFHMLSIISRAGVNLKGPEILGAKTSGILEGEFFGATEGGINEFRLRHAYVMLDWEKTQVGFGQFWHPFVVTEALPNMVNYGTGAPVYGLNRNPQIRVTHKISDKFKVIAALHSQRDFTPNTEPYRNSVTPAAHLQFQYKSDKFVAGLAGQYENLKPKLVSEGYKSNERVESFSAMAYAKLITKPLSITASAYLMQDAATFVMLGGYVGYQKPGEVETYKPINTQSVWMDIQQNSKGRWSLGAFTGVVYNRGVKDPVEGAFSTSYGVTTNWGALSASPDGRTVNYLYKVVPRIDFTASKALKFRFEMERSSARWADATNDATGFENKFLATNYRFHLTSLFNF